jgi:hypothetical protein
MALAAGDRFGQEDGYRGMTLWSLTPFFQETEVFEWRLEELAGIVDCHVVVEATTDHRGNPHEHVFPQRLQHRDDVVYRLIDLKGETTWEREKEQRNRLADGLEIADDDVVLLSDVDEIPSARALTIAAQNATEKPEVLRLAMHVYQPKFRWMDLDDHYQICRVFRGSLLKRLMTGLQRVRDMAGSEVMATGEFPGHGWHMAYMGGPEMIRSKLSCFAHDELENASLDVERSYATGADLFGRSIEVEEVTADDLPVWAR